MYYLHIFTYCWCSGALYWPATHRGMKHGSTQWLSVQQVAQRDQQLVYCLYHFCSAAGFVVGMVVVVVVGGSFFSAEWLIFPAAAEFSSLGHRVTTQSFRHVFVRRQVCMGAYIWDHTNTDNFYKEVWERWHIQHYGLCLYFKCSRRCWHCPSMHCTWPMD